ncbi:hypothetical protein CBL_06705 [Carabus blaptoides fortunei]
MATEAQRLIGISLTKIAQSRAHRGGVSLHKNLLVATVLQKARYIFMEEAYHMVHAGSYCPAPAVHVPQTPQSSVVHQQTHIATLVSSHGDYDQQNYDDDDEGLVALTPEEAGITAEPLGALHHEDTSSESDFLQPNCIRCTDDTPVASSKDKENLAPSSYQSSTSELTYLDLDKSSNVLRERSTSTETGTTTCLKRRRAVTEWETEEAVLSILPKRSKTSVTSASDSGEDEGDDSVFLDEAALFSDCVAREAESTNSSGSSAMEIDRITSLVSIFSFGNLAVNSNSSADSLGKLARSVSTPDLCSSQAKESTVDTLQQRAFLAMTV